MNRKNWIWSAVGVIVATVLFVPLPTFAKGKSGGGGGGSTSTGCSGKGGQSFNVTSNILGPTSDPFQLLSDGLGTYSTYKNSRTDSATSEIQSASCDWVLDLGNSTTRSVRLSMLYPVSSGEPLPSGWPTDGSFVNIPARIIIGCEGNSANTNGSTYGLSVGNMNFGDPPLQCALFVKFFSGGNVYRLSMQAAKLPQSTWATVACQGGVTGSGSQCNSWTVTPGLDANGNAAQNPYTGKTSAVGELVQPSCNGCSGGTPLGLYYVDFSATITDP